MLEGGPDALSERNHALGGSHRIAAVDGSDLGADRLQPLNGLGGASLSEGARAHAGLERPFVGRFARHGLSPVVAAE